MKPTLKIFLMLLLILLAVAYFGYSNGDKSKIVASPAEEQKVAPTAGGTLERESASQDTQPNVVTNTPAEEKDPAASAGTGVTNAGTAEPREIPVEETNKALKELYQGNRVPGEDDIPEEFPDNSLELPPTS